MCRHLLQAGFPVTVFDLQAEAVAAVVALGARATASASELATDSDVILVIVTDDVQVRQVVGEILQSARPGTAIAICSSVHPDTCRELARLADEQGIKLLDAPLARGTRGAEEGKLTVYFGGDEQAVTICRPVFAAFSEHLLHMGPVGAGQITKTCNNLLHWAAVVACYESLTLGAHLGVSPNNLRPALLAGSAESRTLRELDLIGMYWPRKDLETAFALSETSETPMPLMRQVDELIKGITAQDLRALFREG
jgi:3-hydroxyisobutyrate dehydrogenase-like beta-hydroxyacid dehydrogenase